MSGAVNIPVDELGQRLKEIFQNRPVVTCCGAACCNRPPAKVGGGRLPGSAFAEWSEHEQKHSAEKRHVCKKSNKYHPGSLRGERAAGVVQSRALQSRALQSRGFDSSTLNGGCPAWLNLNPETSGKET